MEPSHPVTLFLEAATGCPVRYWLQSQLPCIYSITIYWLGISEAACTTAVSSTGMYNIQQVGGNGRSVSAENPFTHRTPSRIYQSLLFAVHGNFCIFTHAAIYLCHSKFIYSLYMQHFRSIILGIISKTSSIPKRHFTIQTKPTQPTQPHQSLPSTNSTALFALSILATVPPTFPFKSSSCSVPRCHVPSISPNLSTSPTSSFIALAASASISSCLLTRAVSSSLRRLKSSSNRLAVAPGASRRKLASWSVWFSICAERACTRCASLASKGSISEVHKHQQNIPIKARGLQ
jgi:hypothetical protein